LLVHVAQDEVSVVEPDDLRRLSVVTGLDAQGTGAELHRSGLGELADDGSVQLDVAALHDLTEAGATLADWEAGWHAMITYAVGKGWVSADGRFVRAHVEPRSDAR
jgi:hypothetical protein